MTRFETPCRADPADFLAVTYDGSAPDLLIIEIENENGKILNVELGRHQVVMLAAFLRAALEVGPSDKPKAVPS
jgi:hypothetical protein